MSIKSQVVSSTKWNTVATIFNVGLQFLKLAVLTRLLYKADFGLLAIATMVIGFTSIFSDIGLTIGIIHKQNTSENQFSSLFWANIFLSGLIYLLLLGVTPLVSAFYKEPTLNIIIPLLGLEVIANAFGKIFQTVKMRDLEYAFISKVRIFASSVGFVSTVVFAYLQLRVYSLVYGQLLQVLITQLIFVFAGLKTTPIKRHFSIVEIKDYLQIGAYGIGMKMVDYIASRVDVLLIGRIWGMETLGVYNLAKELIVKIYSIINNIVYGIAMSLFAKLQNNVQLLKERFALVLKLLSIIILPIYIVLGLFSDILVPLLYSRAFSEIIKLVQCLCLYGIISSFEQISTAVRDAKGKTNYGLIWCIATLCITLCAILASCNSSIIVLSVAISVASLISFPLFWYINVKLTIEMRLMDYLNIFRKELLIALGLGVSVYLVRLCEDNIVIDITLMVLYILAYFSFVYLKDKNMFQRIMNLKKADSSL